MLWHLQANALHLPFRQQTVQCVVTSPPYWGLRDYKVNDQIGLENTPADYVAKMVSAFREVRRVLRDDGTLWLNLGDAYAANGRGTGGNRVETSPKQRTNHGSYFHEAARPQHGLKPKDLVGIPWRVAFALQADGWYLRSDVIWSKPNPMPESVTDRPTRSHEYLFLLTKSARYYYNAAAIRTPAKSETTKMPDGWDTGPGAHGAFHRNGREKGGPAHDSIESRKARANPQAKSAPTDERNGIRANKQRGHSRRHDGFNGRWDLMKKSEQQVNGANARSVWTIATKPTAIAHFATFPESLVRPCILAGSRPGDLICDPFAGTGTVGKVAVGLGRRAVMADLKYEYLRLDRSKVQVQVGMGL